MSSTRLKHWSERTRGVRLSPFVEACVRLGADPVHVAFGPSERDSDPRWSPWGGPSRPWPALRPIPRSASYRQSRAARWRDVGRQLDRLLDVGTPPPLRETARDLGVGLDAPSAQPPGSLPASRLEARRPVLRTARACATGFGPCHLRCRAPLPQRRGGGCVRLAHHDPEVVSRPVREPDPPACRACCSGSEQGARRALPRGLGGRPCVTRVRWVSFTLPGATLRGPSRCVAVEYRHPCSLAPGFGPRSALLPHPGWLKSPSVGLSGNPLPDDGPLPGACLSNSHPFPVAVQPVRLVFRRSPPSVPVGLSLMKPPLPISIAVSVVFLPA